MGKPDQDGPGPPLTPRGLFGLGIEMEVPVALCVYAGYRMDRWMESSPWWTLVGAFLGVALSFYTFFRRVMPPSGGPDGDRR